MIKNLSDDLQIIESKQTYLASLGDFTAPSFVITTKEEAGQVADTKDAIKLAIKDIEERRMVLISRPLNAVNANAIKQEREITQPMKDALVLLKEKGMDWLTKVRKEQEETARIAKQKEVNRINAEADEVEEQAYVNDNEQAIDDSVALREKAESVKDAPIQEIKTSVRSSTGFGGMHVRKNWKVKVDDFSKLPDMYKMINESKLNGVVRGKNGERKIEGCTIWEAESVI